jgi:hypothetical protein
MRHRLSIAAILVTDMNEHLVLQSSPGSNRMPAAECMMTTKKDTFKTMAHQNTQSSVIHLLLYLFIHVTLIISIAPYKECYFNSSDCMSLALKMDILGHLLDTKFKIMQIDHKILKLVVRNVFVH